MSLWANIIIENAKIFTSDEEAPYAEAVAIQGNLIIYVGTNQGAMEFRNETTLVVNGQGHTLTAGFIDSHIHLLSGAKWMGYASLQDATTKEEMQTRLRDYANKNPDAKWIIGWRSHYDIVSTRQELDEIISDRPVYVRTADAHTAWANTKALELAGILHKTKGLDDESTILRDKQGVATGELREAGMKAVLDIIPPPDEAYIRAQLKRAAHEFNKTGITSVHNMNGDMRDLMTYAAAEDAGDLNLRVYVPFEVKPEAKEEDLNEAVEMKKLRGDYVRGGAVKFFMDGVWESYTAFNLEPYADDPNIKVEPLF